MSNQSLPNQSGTFIAWEPEYRDMGDENWHRIYPKQSPTGVPDDSFAPGITSTIHLMGHAQAMAIAWWYIAERAFDLRAPLCEVRVVPFKVEYRIDAYKKEDEAITLHHNPKAQPREPGGGE